MGQLVDWVEEEGRVIQKKQPEKTRQGQQRDSHWEIHGDSRHLIILVTPDNMIMFYLYFRGLPNTWFITKVNYKHHYILPPSIVDS